MILINVAPPEEGRQGPATTRLTGVKREPKEAPRIRQAPAAAERSFACNQLARAGTT
jgi:hypothetical protein